jgi:hypothetical protein
MLRLPVVKIAKPKKEAIKMRFMITLFAHGMPMEERALFGQKQRSISRTVWICFPKCVKIPQNVEHYLSLKGHK